jgi:hypothetical protein
MTRAGNVLSLSLSLSIILLSFFPRAFEPQRSVEVENRGAHELGHIPLVVIQVLGIGDQEPCAGERRDFIGPSENASFLQRSRNFLEVPGSRRWHY